MRIVFAGTPGFAVPALRALAGTKQAGTKQAGTKQAAIKDAAAGHAASGYAAARHDIVAVYTQPDRPAGRGRKLTAGLIKQTAQSLNIPVEQPEHLRDAEAAARLASYAPDVMVVAAYGLILPPAVLQVPRLGCINIHASLLPRWRGAAPIHRAILAGDTESGVCIMQMEKGLDTGPVFLERRIAIAPEDTGGSLHDKLAALGAEAIVEALALIERGAATAKPQDVAAVTYAHKIEKSEASIDWNLSAEQLSRQVRAFNPWPIAQTRWRDAQLRIWAARALTDEQTNELLGSILIRVPGTVLSASAQGIVVACGRGALAIDSVQLPGGRQISAVDFLNSHDLNHVRFG